MPPRILVISALRFRIRHDYKIRRSARQQKSSLLFHRVRLLLFLGTQLVQKLRQRAGAQAA